MKLAKFDFSQPAVTNDTSDSIVISELRSIGFTQVLVVGAASLLVPTIANRYENLGPVGELKSAILWSKGFDLFFFDKQDRSEWATYANTKLDTQDPFSFCSSSLSSWWPKHYDRTKLAKLDFDSERPEDFWSAAQHSI